MDSEAQAAVVLAAADPVAGNLFLLFSVGFARSGSVGIGNLT